MPALFERMTVIGVGLIGGSLARAARAKELCAEIVGYGRDIEQLRLAVELGVIDSFESDIAQAVEKSDLIVLAAPVGAMRDLFLMIKPHVRKDALITDVGSSKQSVVDDAAQVWDELPEGFVPGHPIAGTEKSGVKASFAELFEHRCTILTPVPQSAPWAIDKLRKLWEGVGAEVAMMDAHHHDEVLAATSHIPHVLAFALVDTLGRMQERKEIFRFAAGGFRDFTRIASSDPEMWRDICLHNSDAIIHVLHLFRKELDTLEDAIRSKNGEAVKTILQRAKQLRDTNVVV
ncbi:MAG: prephenate dehydrogenase/arogenate dehydrogenase family protein [Gammaproteobacteria bacterium]|nr:prephenate dehydrogenase/arogenate dehydrogenase family protein [Gammaproteobacteria bacterium]